MSQPGTAAMPPSLEIMHLLPVGRTAASCQCPPTAGLLKAPIDSQEAATMIIKFYHVLQQKIRYRSSLFNHEPRAL
jgi:hypothetical protein